MRGFAPTSSGQSQPRKRFYYWNTLTAPHRLTGRGSKFAKLARSLVRKARGDEGSVVGPDSVLAATRPFQLVTGRVWRGTAFGGAKGRTEVPKIVDWYMDGKINIDDLITRPMPLEKINDAFHLMHEGESIRSVVTF